MPTCYICNVSQETCHNTRLNRNKPDNACNQIKQIQHTHTHTEEELQNQRSTSYQPRYERHRAIHPPNLEHRTPNARIGVITSRPFAKPSVDDILPRSCGGCRRGRGGLGAVALARVLRTAGVILAAGGLAERVALGAVLDASVVALGAEEVGDGFCEFGGVGADAVAADAGEMESILGIVRFMTKKKKKRDVPDHTRFVAFRSTHRAAAGRSEGRTQFARDTIGLVLSVLTP